MSPPLTGVLLLDLSRVLAGPFCTMLLGPTGSSRGLPHSWTGRWLESGRYRANDADGRGELGLPR